MSYRDRDPRDYRPGNPDFRESRPDQYGTEHYSQRQYGPERGPRQGSQRDWQTRGSGDWPGRDSRDWRSARPRDEHSRDEQAFSRDEQPFAQEPSAHAPFNHSAFGESSEPRYFGTGSQGHGGGPSFTGGTYGTADWRSDAPYFDEVGFNRGNYEDPVGRDPDVRPLYRQRYGAPTSR